MRRWPTLPLLVPGHPAGASPFARGWGLHGLWTGALAANAVQACLMLGIALTFDYAGAARKAAARFALAAPLLADPEA